jgi:hypothetical protein
LNLRSSTPPEPALSVVAMLAVLLGGPERSAPLLVIARRWLGASPPTIESGAPPPTMDMSDCSEPVRPTSTTVGRRARRLSAGAGGRPCESPRSYMSRR